ncbi:MAG: hypothetical protein JSW55_05750 [Chloroflexota bacterium]|nr:MAG: hypothetical protein JSW55_05750 [Chloroflexota bacterium]
MVKLFTRMGIFPYLVLGFGLLLLGLLALNHVTANLWPIDVGRLDLIRSTALDRAEATTLLRSANLEIVFAFLAALLVTVTGLALPIAYILNRRFGRSPSSSLLVVLRQAMWVGLWVAFCAWLQMHRSLGLGVALLSAIVLVVVEMLLQVRTRAAAVSG